MIKRIGLILLSILLFLSFNICAVGAESTATEITSPGLKEVVGEEFSEILFTAPEGACVSLKLDNNEIFYGISEGSNSVILSDELSFGEHNLKLTSLLEGTVTSDDIVFSKETSVSETIDNVPGYPHQESYEAGIDADGNKVYAVFGNYPGKNGEDDGSVGFKIENLSGRYITKPQIAYNFTLSDYKDDMVDKVKLAFDLKITNAYRFGFEMKNGNGNWIQPGGSVFFSNNYTIVATGASYPNNEWMEMEIIFDVPMQTIEVWINGEKAISEYKAESNLKGLQFIRFLLEPRPSVAEQGYYIDNFKLITTKSFSGFSDVSYKSGEEFKPLEHGEISEPVKEFKFKTDMVPTAFTGELSAKCYADGYEVKVENTGFETVVNEETGAEEYYVTTTLANEISGDTELEFLIENTVAEDKKLTFGKRVSVNTNTNRIGSIEYSLNDVPCISERQLKAGDTLKAKFSLENYSGEATICVMGIYSGKKLVALSAETAESATCEVSAVLPEAEDGYTLQCFIIDSYESRKAQSGSKKID